MTPQEWLDKAMYEGGINGGLHDTFISFPLVNVKSYEFRD